MEKIEKLMQLLPLGSIFILLCSSIKLVIYYKAFNISIVDYIGIQEFITTFIDDILLYLCIFGISIFLSLFDIAQNRAQNLALKSDTPIKYKNQRKISLSLAILTLILISFLSYYYSNSTVKTIEIIFVGLFIFLGFLRIFLSSTKLTLPFGLYISISVILYTVMYGYTDAYKIIENKDKLNYVILFKEKTYYTDRSLKYIGKTENFLFLFNLKSKRTTILKNDDLIKISIK
ncbi:hypothetical protein [Flavobacterium reichenbachii]|uniref:Uncharacterized protein n=1 Tax=Flavobacterium reichenbachii TaxID=362418 RepID=A0A085ZNU0_9FLAO|nr:hypothetical protein [Flavobacterium reichenbachii]KFF06104.1 hypothetical protein IW19_11445 [Flavobacterium reichenbachii]OXB14672.1 hypothetical protein B0A68_11500 [Flavobacterium reichenbachii]